MVSLGCLAKAGQEQGDNTRLGGPETGTPDGMEGLSLVLHSAVQALCSQNSRNKATETGYLERPGSEGS